MVLLKWLYCSFTSLRCHNHVFNKLCYGFKRNLCNFFFRHLCYISPLLVKAISSKGCSTLPICDDNVSYNTRHYDVIWWWICSRFKTLQYHWEPFDTILPFLSSFDIPIWSLLFSHGQYFSFSLLLPENIFEEPQKKTWVSILRL